MLAALTATDNAVLSEAADFIDLPPEALLAGHVARNDLPLDVSQYAGTDLDGVLRTIGYIAERERAFVETVEVIT